MTIETDFVCPVCKGKLQRHCAKCAWFRCPHDDWHVTFDPMSGRMVDRGTGSNLRTQPEGAPHVDDGE